MRAIKWRGTSQFYGRSFSSVPSRTGYSTPKGTFSSCEGSQIKALDESILRQIIFKSTKPHGVLDPEGDILIL